ncbi:MAG: helix-turn-helix domain-containing protein [Bacteroidales bacterium]|nr:helix-turn-helix domain-containing protein [Bacteroidales bacterium]
MEKIENREILLAFDFVQYTNRNLFLTGKAGTGKTTFLHNLKKKSPKRMIVVAPTGVAAINAGGVTIHSFFQLPFHPHIPVQYVAPGIGSEPPGPMETSSFKLGREKINILKSLDLLVIDEISMVRADLLDAVDSVLRRYKDRNQPFGGVQLLMIGDIQQLAPVVKEEDWEIIGKYYETAFFFGSLALRRTNYVTIELKHIYRQRDIDFIHLLNKIRDNQMDAGALAELNKRYDPHFNPGDQEGYITLTTHNAQAQTINDLKLNKLPGKTRSFKAVIQNDFPEFTYPTAFELVFKIGAQVMFVKNDLSRDKLYYNGKIGRIVDFEEDTIIVQCPGDDGVIPVEMAEWQNMKYSLNPESKEIDETVIGTFTQYPLKLAWAITIHKSQGLTFDKAIIDASAAFAHGQVYVALSRCRTLDGLVLSTQVTQRGIISDPTVTGFVREAEQNQPDQEQLAESKKIYQQMLLTELFDFTTLVRGLQYCLKVVQENRESILGNPENMLDMALASVKSDLVEVSAKFYPQLRNLILLNADAETNDKLQERIQKAGGFFSEKLENAMQGVMAGIVIETDNKDVRKVIADALTRLRQDAQIKQACLHAARSGFKIQAYLEVKAKAAIEAPPVKTPVIRSVEDTSGTIQHPGLYNKLKIWRNHKALEQDQPHYMVLPQATLATLTNFLPMSVKELKKVKGMGKVKTEKYGDELLSIIQAYCRENNLESPADVFTAKKAPAKVRVDTKLASLNLYKAGKTVIQIAEERNMAPSTIEGHLAHYVGTGDIPVTEFVSPGKTEFIASHFEGNGDYQLGPVKSALGEQVSWSELRFVVKHLEFVASNMASSKRSKDP